MEINDCTEITAHFSFFADGDGFFIQQYKIFADGKETGVSMNVSRQKDKPAKRVFCAEGREFQTLGDALMMAGHNVNKQENESSPEQV